MHILTVPFPSHLSESSAAVELQTKLHQLWVHHHGKGSIDAHKLWPRSHSAILEIDIDGGLCKSSHWVVMHDMVTYKIFSHTSWPLCAANWLILKVLCDSSKTLHTAISLLADSDCISTPDTFSRAWHPDFNKANIRAWVSPMPGTHITSVMIIDWLSFLLYSDTKLPSSLASNFQNVNALLQEDLQHVILQQIWLLWWEL
jgi:hypothetical protein